MNNKFVIQTYNIGIIRQQVGDLLESTLQKDIVWLKHRYKDRFFADPFLWYQDISNFYILVEEFIFWEERGKITLLIVDKNKFELIDKRTVIDEPYHLSFPFCNEDDDVIIPESVASGKCFKYEISKDTYKINKKEIVVNEGLIDQTFISYKGTEWLFTSKAQKPSAELHIYYRNCDGDYVESERQPIKTDNRTSRSAGRFFFWNNKLVRPVQDCYKRYGHQTKLMEIVELDKSNYMDREIKTISSISNPPYNETLHTFNVYDGFIIVDGSKDYVRFPMKIFYKKCKPLMKIVKRGR